MGYFDSLARRAASYWQLEQNNIIVMMDDDIWVIVYSGWFNVFLYVQCRHKSLLFLTQANLIMCYGISLNSMQAYLANH